MKDKLKKINQLFIGRIIIIGGLILITYIFLGVNKELGSFMNAIPLGVGLYIYAMIMEMLKNVNTRKWEKYPYIIIITVLATAILISRDNNNFRNGRYEQAIKTYDIHYQLHKCKGLCDEAINYEEEIEKYTPYEVDDSRDY